jgi:hypothetical protein
MVTDIGCTAGGQKHMPGDSVCWDDRVRNWDEEWLSQLLEEALRLKEKFGEKPPKPARAKSAKT